jgi:CheY-like chemotaxis protein
MELESELGHGARFTVFLPTTVPTADDAPAPAGPAVALDADSSAIAYRRRETASAPGETPPAARILLIEDDASAVRLLRELLEPAGYIVDAVATGLAGIEAARTAPPAAILLDIVLSDIDGWEVLRRLKADHDLADIPVVVATVVDERELGLALGAVDYLLKPIDRDALLRAVRRCIPAGSSPTRVLAIDDDAATLDFVAAALADEGIQVTATTSPHDALERARVQSFDLIVCDLLMPECDGFELIRALKADERSAHIPVLLCTAVNLSDADKARLNGQVAGIVAKGSDAATELRAALRSLVGRGQPEVAT